MVKLILADAVVPDFGLEFAEEDDESILLQALGDDGYDLLPGFESREVLLPDCPAEDCLHECLAISGYPLIAAVELGDCLLEEHGVDLLVPDWPCEHGHLVEDGHVVVNDHVLYLAVLVKAELVNPVFAQGLAQYFFELLRVSSRNQHQSVLKLLVAGHKLLQALRTVLL